MSAKENANKVTDTFGTLEDLDFGAFQSSDLVMKVEVDVCHPLPVVFLLHEG